MLSKRVQLTILSVSLVLFFVLGFVYIGNSISSPLNAESGSTDNYLTISDEKLSLFLDTNYNQSKDTEEGICKQCIGKQIIVEINTDTGKELVIREVSKEGLLDLSNLKVSKIWAYIEDPKLVIPIFSFAPELQGTEINIPAVKIENALIGENTNIQSIKVNKVSDEYYQTIFTIPFLPPVIENAVSVGTPLWMVYYPEGKNQTNYQVSHIQTSEDGSNTIMKAIWNLDEELKSLKKAESYLLLIPAGN